MNPRRTSKTAAVVTAAALFLSLAACADTAEGGAEAEEAAEEETIELGVARSGVSIENVLLAHEQGFFEEEGLEISEIQTA
ncbi:hypothetical protein [Nesterenkonia pannonica]|uniref:hypothetical protein n=1 Tax=Nesterenkonia pannonica TaxID=1548602 RepID=UPI00216452CE|nr:hypothetical protein [Nesterenkonia pannonica]